MNVPKQQGNPPESSHSSLDPQSHSLDELTHPVRVSAIERINREVAALTLDTFIESLVNARRILSSHRLTSEFPASSPTSRAGRELPPPPAEQVGGLVKLRPSPDRKLIVIGDVHGDAESLLTILSHSRIIERVESGEDLYLLGLGDYVNKGPQSLESVYILSRLLNDPVLKGRVILLRGNHEDRHGSVEKEETRLRKKFFTTINNHSLSKQAQPRTVQRAVAEAALYFDELPHTLYSTCGLLAAHSGYSQWIVDRTRKKVWETLREWPPHQQIMKELLDSSIAPSTSSKDAKKADHPSPMDTYRLMEKLDVTLLIRGHQSAAPLELDPRETWKSGYWYLSHTQPSVSRGILTLNSSKFCGVALPAFAEVELMRERIGLEDCTLYTLPNR